MVITTRDLLLLQALARYHVLDRGQVQELLFPHDTVGVPHVAGLLPSPTRA